VKGLDTAVLLAILEGRATARELLRRLRGHELATTEVNLLELEVRAAAGPTGMRGPRRLAIERLRRKLTVLPVDARAVSEASRHLGVREKSPDPALIGLLGALEANGCDEFYTDRSRLPGAGWRLKPLRFRAS
jgi:predicted nucleic acid-binding protein